MFVRVETFFLALICIFVCSKNSWFVSCRQDIFQNSLANHSNDLILDMFLSAGANGTGRSISHWRQLCVPEEYRRTAAKSATQKSFTVAICFCPTKIFFFLHSEQ